MIKNVFFLAIISLTLVFAGPCFAADKAHSTAGAIGLVSTLLYSYAPWIVGFALDTAISKMAVKTLRSLMTSTLSLVLGYPSVLFAFSSLAAPGGPDSMAAWALASSALVLGLGTVKIVSYWVVNEAFPNKKTAVLLYFNAVVMVGAAYATQVLINKQ